MKCLHCRVEFHDERQDYLIGKDADNVWGIERFDCPACKRMNLYLVNANQFAQPQYAEPYFDNVVSVVPIRPRGSSRPLCPADVPIQIASDYHEACLVLSDSPTASAALSRRCLQVLLREAASVKQGDLYDEIQQAIDSRTLPSNLAEMLHVVRTIGNFAAHPMKSKHTGEILPVEPQEAEWNLDVLEALFDFYYVQPALIKKKKDALNEKLQEAGKKPIS